MAEERGVAWRQVEYEFSCIAPWRATWDKCSDLDMDLDLELDLDRET
jgi:hypothetical protein